MPSPRLFSVLASSTLALSATWACAPHGGDDPVAFQTIVPEPAPEPDPFPANPDGPTPFSTPSISSVHVMHDCPPPAPAQPASLAASERPSGDEAPGAGARFRCAESTMQMAFTPHEGPGHVVIHAVTMRSADSDRALSNIHVHRPTRWNDQQGYADWDMRLPAREDTRASFVISNFDWSGVESKLGNKRAPASSWGQMYVIEAEVEIDGVRRTIRSPQFSRDDPDMVVT
jgi:hypothetical protein